MDLTIFSILVGISVSGLTAAITFGRNPIDPLNRTFLMWGGATWIWGVGILFRVLAPTPAWAKVFFAVGLFGAQATVAVYILFAAVFLQHVIPGEFPKRLLRMVWLLVILSGLGLFLLTPLSSWVIHRFEFIDGRAHPEVGSGFYVIVGWGLTCVVLGVGMILGMFRRIEEEQERKQALTIVAAPVIPAVLFGVLEFVLASTGTGRFIGEAYMATTVFTLVIAYGILRYHLMVITPEMAATQVLSALPDGVALVDLEGTAKNVNRAFADLVGRRREEILGKPIWEFMAGEDTPSREQAREGSSTRLDFHLGVKTPMGQMVPVSATYEPLLNAQGACVGSIVVFRDLRTLRKLQAELVQAEKLAGIGELVAGVAHEFNSPLTVILGVSERGTRTDLGDRAKEAFEQIVEQAIRARDIVSKLLKFARKGEGKRERCDLHMLIQDAIEMVSLGAPSETIAYQTEFTDEPLEVHCTPEELRQLFLNLLQNARQAILGDRGAGTVTISTGKAGAWGTVRVRDDGPGIPTEFLPKIFDPFFTTKEV
ncbi:MAG: histidine kinase dimerization/phospho-acceptor domain-containing protein, partial [Planctomycetota bacterium]